MSGCAIFDPPDDAVGVHLDGVFDNGVTDAAAAINKLIDEIAAKGGGIIYFPPGVYPCRYTIHLKDRVHLRLDPGAMIRRCRPAPTIKSSPTSITNTKILGTAIGITA